MSFGSPMMLWFLPVVLAGMILCTGLESARRKKLARMFPPAIRSRMQQGTLPELFALRQLLMTAGLLLTAFSLARPQWGYTWRDAQREGLQLMTVIDTSNSMRADDFQPTRLQRAKWGIEELVQSLQGDKIGLVAFAGDGQLLCPLTLDYGTYLMYLQDLFPGIAPLGGTNLSAALQTAIDGFEAVPEADRVILLITDGENHTGDLTAVTEQLVEKDIHVFAVGVGTPEGSLIPLNETGNTFLKNRRDEVVKSTLDEAPLRRLAAATDGLYLRATPRDFGAAALVEEGLAPLKRAQLEGQRVKEMEERYALFLSAGILCLMLERLARLPAALLTRRSA